MPDNDFPMEPETKPGTIGKKRSQRLHALITQNGKKTGFTEEKLKELMARMELEHLSDLPVQLHDQMEGYCNGTDTRWK